MKRQNQKWGSCSRVLSNDPEKAQRGQTLAQMALAWVLRLSGMTSALVGASKVEQVDENVATLKNLNFTSEELKTIDSILGE